MDRSKKIRVVAYIDGFNFYHSVANNLPKKYKWLNYRKLVEKYLCEGEQLEKIFLFTANPKWDPDRIIRHNDFMRIMVSLGIVIISGNYTATTKKFNANKNTVTSPPDAIVSPRRFEYSTFEEKQTDVNMALAIFEGGIMDMYDKAFIFSGDSDIAPAIHKVRKYRKDKKFTSILPYLGK